MSARSPRTTALEQHPSHPPGTDRSNRTDRQQWQDGAHHPPPRQDHRGHHDPHDECGHIPAPPSTCPAAGASSKPWRVSAEPAATAWATIVPTRSVDALQGFWTCTAAAFRTLWLARWNIISAAKPCTLKVFFHPKVPLTWKSAFFSPPVFAHSCYDALGKHRKIQGPCCCVPGSKQK